MELLPPNFDDSGRTKYPVLFRVYGGPYSQMVHTRFDRDWHAYLACGLKYVVVMVDGRGTGFKGRRLRNPVRENLGYWETRDQIEAARCVPWCYWIENEGLLTQSSQSMGIQEVRGPQANRHLGLGEYTFVAIEAGY